MNGDILLLLGGLVALLPAQSGMEETSGCRAMAIVYDDSV